MIVAGKGGVGKTTVSAALACLAARHGLNTLIVEVEGQSGLPALFGRTAHLTYQPVVLATGGGGGAGGGEILARTLTPDDALVEYLEDHGMRRVSRRLVATGTLEVIATAIPGVKDILVLGKVKQLEEAGAADLIVVDGPAAGHAVTFLASAQGLADAASVGPIRSQAADVIGLLNDPARCQVLLVTLPEETPVNEAVETAFHLEDRAGVRLAPVVVNGLWPTLDLPSDPAGALAELAAEAGAGAGMSGDEVAAVAAAADFRKRRQDLQAEQVARLAEGLPLAQLPLPYLFTTELGPAEVSALADALAAGIEALDPVRLP